MNTHYPFSHFQKVVVSDGKVFGQLSLLIEGPFATPSIENTLLRDDLSKGIIFKEDLTGGHSIPTEPIRFPIGEETDVFVGTYDSSGLEANKLLQTFKASDFSKQPDEYEDDFRPFVFLEKVDGETGFFRLRIRINKTKKFTVGVPTKMEVGGANPFLQIVISEELAVTPVIFSTQIDIFKAVHLEIPGGQIDRIEILVKNTAGKAKGGGKVSVILSNPKPFDWADKLNGAK